MSGDKPLLSTLAALGFTSTEAKAYVALLKDSPATGYEVAARSGVPRSAVYGVLKKLAEQGFAMLVDDDPARYAPLPPDELEKLLRHRFDSTLGAMKRSLETLAAPAQKVTWTTRGYGGMLEQAERLIRQSKSSLYGSLWGREAARLAEPLAAARDAGVELILFSFNALDESLGTVLSYGIEEGDLEAYWPHKIILVSDHGRALLGGAEDLEDNRVVVTDEPALVETAVANLVLDITLLGQRRKLDTGRIVTRLTELLAPVEELSTKRH